MTSDPMLVARLLDLVARQLHSANARDDLVAGQWAILRYLDTAGARSRTAAHIANYLGASVPETRLALLSLQRKQLIECREEASNEQAYHLTPLGSGYRNADPIRRAAEAIGSLREADRAELARLLEAVASKMVSKPPRDPETT